MPRMSLYGCAGKISCASRSTSAVLTSWLGCRSTEPLQLGDYFVGESDARKMGVWSHPLAQAA